MTGWRWVLLNILVYWVALSWALGIGWVVLCKTWRWIDKKDWVEDGLLELEDWANDYGMRGLQ